MMIQEFIDRTGYTPSAMEYHYIEESYYESPLPNKDEFCKQFKKDLRSGKWDMEYELRQRLDAQKSEYESKQKELQETVDWYSRQYEQMREMIKQAEKNIARKNDQLEALKRRAERLMAAFENEVFEI